MATISLSDFKTYVVLVSANINLSDFKNYVVIKPYVAPPYTPEATPPITARLARGQIQKSTVPKLTRRYLPFANYSQIMADTAVSTDTFGFSSSNGLMASDSVASSDSLAPVVYHPESLADSVASSDSFGWTLSASGALTDSVHSMDVYGQPLVNIGQVVQSALVAANAPINFSGINQRVLLSAKAPVNVAQLTRRSLSLVLPPSGYGPAAVFPPPPIGYPVKVSPVLDTIVGTTKSLREMRVPQQTYPIWDIEILYEGLKDQTQNQTPYAPFAGYTQYQQVLQNWLMMYGQSNVFLFSCPWDNSRFNQPIGTGDGLTYVFTLQRTWGIGATATAAPIGQLNQMIGVFIDGVPQPTYTYNTTRNQLIFTNPTTGAAYPPPNGSIIAVTFTYYYLCRFVEDEQDFEEFSKNRWTIPSLKFRASPW